MSKRGWLILVAIVALLLVAAAFLLPERGGPRQVIALDVTGAAGRRVVGTATVDGVVHELAGVLPVQFEHRGQKLEVAVAPVEPEPGEQITVKVFMDGRQYGSCTAAGVRVTAFRGGLFSFRGRSFGISGMSADEAAKLTK